MNLGFLCSGLREPISTKFRTVGQGRTKMSRANFDVSRFIGLGATWGRYFGLCL